MDVLAKLKTRFDPAIVQPDELAREAHDEIVRLRLENLNRLSKLNDANKRIRSLMGAQ